MFADDHLTYRLTDISTNSDDERRYISTAYDVVVKRADNSNNTFTADLFVRGREHNDYQEVEVVAYRSYRWAASAV